ncbi:uncharacterized protein [Diadema antillarum]|uniref:uncharacterized protein n=1 Tax=Diadema antillarum TaxID=105358 RepID=UPI003A855E77
MAYQNKRSSNLMGDTPSAVRGRAGSLHNSAQREQRKLEEHLQALSKEMRSRMNELDSEASEMRRQAVRMNDAVRRKEHLQRAMFGELSPSGMDTSTTQVTDLLRTNSSNRLHMSSLSNERNTVMAPLPQIWMGRSYSSPASIAKTSVADNTDNDLDLAMSRSDISDESIAADAASIPVTNMPNFCSGRELEMIGETTSVDERGEEGSSLDDDDGAVFSNTSKASSDPQPHTETAEESPLPPTDHPTRTSTQSNLTSKSTLLRRRRVSDIARPVGLSMTQGGNGSARRHSTNDPTFCAPHQQASGTSELLLYRTSSVDLPPLRHPAIRHRASTSQLMSPPLSPGASKRASRVTGSLRRGSQSESSPCIMKQTFATTPRRGVSRVVGELVHIEEMRRFSGTTSMEENCRKIRRAWTTNRSLPSNGPQRVIGDDLLPKTRSLGDLFNELKDCRYLRISNQESTG